MSKHFASAQWNGNLVEGKGGFTLKSNGYQGDFNFGARFEADKSASSPEELIGAAHAGCFSMALSHALAQADFKPEKIETKAEVTLAKAGDSFEISEILLITKGTVPDISKDKFNEMANGAKENCPVSKALKGVNIKLEATLA
jgi:osmotically inducible protein OsmC